MNSEGLQFVSQLSYTVPPTGMTELEIAWANMRVADQELYLPLFLASFMGWFKAKAGKGTYSLLEMELRHYNFDTHLLAKTPTLTGVSLQVPYDSETTEMQFECIVSCRPRQLAMAELLTLASCYQENFDRLSRTGSAMIDSIQDEAFVNQDAGKIRVFSNRVKDFLEPVTRNKVLVKKTEITMDSVLARYPDASSKLLYIHATGPVVVFVVNDKICSPVGFLVTYTSTGEQLFKAIKL